MGRDNGYDTGAIREDRLQALDFLRQQIDVLNDDGHDPVAETKIIADVVKLLGVV